MHVYFVLFLVVPMATGHWVKPQKYSCLGPVSPLHTSQYKQRSIQSSVIPWTCHPVPTPYLSVTPQLAADTNQPQYGPRWWKLVWDECRLEHIKGRQGKCQEICDSQNKHFRQNIATDVAFDLDQELSKLKSVFADFEKACEHYENALTDDDELDKCDDYFRKVQDNFIGTVAEIKTVKQGPDSKSDGASSATPVSQTCDIEKLISAINLPKLEIASFTGNPLKYYQFMQSFDLNVDSVCTDDSQKLSRLIQYCSGAAKSSIEGCILRGSDGYKEALKILAERFGNPDVVSEQVIANIRHGKLMKTSQDLLALSDELDSANRILNQLKLTQEVSLHSVILDVMARTPTYLQNNWQKLALKKKKSSGSYPKFDDLCEFIADAARNASDPVYGQSYMKRERPGTKVSLATSNDAAVPDIPKERAVADSPQATTQVLPSTGRSSTYAKPEYPCVMCTQRHRLWHCNEFKMLSVRDRIALVDRYALCHNCLLPTHNTASCGKKSVCSVQNCGQKHTMYLHTNSTQQGSVAACAADGQSSVSSCGALSNQACYMPIVKVKVNDTVYANALLDTASSNSFCSEALACKLGVTGVRENFNLRTIGATCRTESEVVALSVTSSEGYVMDMSGVYITSSIPVTYTPIDLSKFEHLQDLNFPGYSKDGKVDLLIGQDNAEALVPLAVRKGKGGEPFAILTCLGWALNGCGNTSRVSDSVVSHFISTQSISSQAESTNNDVNKLLRMENEGLEGIGYSQEDHEVIKLWDVNCRKDGLHYELPIPWKNPLEPLPNNYRVAKCRLDSLVRKLEREGNYDRYEQEIDKLLDRGYAEPVPADEVQSNSGRVWYLPHHAVVSDKKPGIVRVVYDCASKYGGQSLNDRCMQGPDLINKLLFVLLRFRLHTFAIQADIEAMYNQVRVPQCDRDALRFLWMRDGKVMHYRMTSHLFGGIWCASSSAYALRRTVVDHDVLPVVRDTVERAMYVDDCLKSVAQREEAKIVISNVRDALKLGGFNLTKFIVNDESLYAEIPSENRAISANDITPESAGKVLGVQWSILPDEFYFELNKTIPVYSVSRRMILSTVSSIYDPLGFIGPIVLPGKVIFQECTRQKFSWDECVSHELESQWANWVNSLHDIGDLRIPRCVKPSDFDHDAVFELHHFADASMQAYGVCSYVRSINKNGKIHVQLLISKNKVAPLNQSTVPRLELQAAVVAAKLDAMLRNELDIEIDQSYFWTDSQITLGYITNTIRRFNVFVENRVSLIRQLTDVSAWNHVCSKDNPADYLTRSKITSVHQLDSFWFEGPMWLRSYKCQWPKQSKDFKLNPGDPEIKSAAVTLTGMGIPSDSSRVLKPEVISVESEMGASPLDVAAASSDACLPAVEECNEMQTISSMSVVTDSVAGHKADSILEISKHYSDWYKMQRGLAWWLRFVQCLKDKDFRGKGRLSVAEINRAKLLLIESVQRCSYPAELNKLKKGNEVNKSSPVRCLKPFLDSDGVMCVGGRMPDHHPYIIPHDHPCARAIVWHYHSQVHAGAEWTLALLRDEFWIVRARPLVRKIVRSCITCRRSRAKPLTQLMADLPEERLKSDKPAFSYIAIDVFGPLTVKNYRSEIKRYGCLFTCMTTRAVHVEKLNSLDADSFINAFRRFIARRGIPEGVFSDNGTNLVAGEKELRHAFEEILASPKLNAYSVTKGIEWRFIPPASPHMGGVWERMVGLMKRVLMSVLRGTSRLSDEVLETIFCEAEAVVNGRPLTKLSDDPNDGRPLTPNHLLLLKQGSILPPGCFHSGDVYRRRWRHVQSLADQFWSK